MMSKIAKMYKEELKGIKEIRLEFDEVFAKCSGEISPEEEKKILDECNKIIDRESVLMNDLISKITTNPDFSSEKFWGIQWSRIIYTITENRLPACRIH